MPSVLLRALAYVALVVAGYYLGVTFCHPAT